MGDDETGKTSLIAKLAGSETVIKSSGLEYNFLDIRDEYREESTKLGVWILDGNVQFAKLLDFALAETSIEDASCLLVASMGEPWNILKSLEKWIRVLEEHIERMNVKESKLKQMKRNIAIKFMNYTSPLDEAETKLVTSKPLDSKFKDSSNNNSDLNVSDDGYANESSELSGNALKENIGIPLVVVITKTDMMSDLEKNYDYTEETFDFIQQAIRKFCLRFGATLFYVSSKTNTNCDLLHKYLAHLIYELPFKTPASVIAKESIFVPAGWDNLKKISILYDNIRSVDPDDDYNEFVLERDNPQPTSREQEVVAEDDQTFLSRMQIEIGKQQGPVQASNQNTQSGNAAQQRQNITAPIGDGQQPSEGVLQNFFNSLLSNQRSSLNKMQ